MSKLSRYGLSILSGVLLWLAWPMSPLFFLVFFGFVPLLILEDFISKNEQKTGRKVFLYSFIAFLIWNLATTWWVWNASPGGSVAAIICNALLQSLPFLAFHHTKKRMGDKLGFISLVVFWVGFEFVHLSWEFTWPWLTLGNVFAKIPAIVQWYELTGHLGGSVWVLILNILFFKSWANKTLFSTSNYKPMLAILVPLAVSFFLIPNEKTEEQVVVMAVQPNVDSYTEKFPFNARTGERNKETFVPYNVQLQNLINLTQKNLTSDVKIVLWPETALPYGCEENSMLEDEMILMLKDFCIKNKVSLVAGANSYTLYGNEKKTPTARFIASRKTYYDEFNTAFFFDQNGKVAVYHKSKLVPGVERMPYPGLFSFLEYFAIDLGGVAGSLGEQAERTVFFTPDNIGIAPAICYESVFGDFVSQYMNNGAHFIAVITNDGWWDNTPGHKQHFEYARLRAVENRTWVARAANTGISGFISPYGEVKSTLGWDKEGVVKYAIVPSKEKTTYAKYGDYLGRIAAGLSIALLFSVLVKKLRKI